MLNVKKNIFKLYYFNSNFRAQVIRALLHCSQVTWEDIKLSEEEYLKLCEEGKFEDSAGLLPVLEYKGKTFSQTHAIELFLAKKLKYYFINEDEENQFLVIQGIIDDVIREAKPVCFPENENEENNQISKFKVLIEESLPHYFGILEKILVENYVNKQRNIFDNLHQVKVVNPEYQNQEEEITPQFESKINNLDYFIPGRLTLADFLVGIFFNNFVNHPLRREVLKPILQKFSPNIDLLITSLCSSKFKDYFEKIHIIDSKM